MRVQADKEELAIQQAKACLNRDFRMIFISMPDRLEMLWLKEFDKKRFSVKRKSK